MTKILAAALILELVILFVHDIHHSRGSFALRFQVRIAAGAAGLLSLLAWISLDRTAGMPEVAAGFFPAVAALSMYPCSFERPAPAFKAVITMGCLSFANALSAALLPSGCTLFRSQWIVLAYVTVVTSIMVYYIGAAHRRFKGIRLFFRNQGVWFSMEDYSRFLFLTLSMCMGILSLAAVLVPGDAGTVLGTVLLAFLGALYALLYLRAMSGRTYILDFDTEERVRDIIKGNLRTSYIDKADEDRKMNNLYKKIMAYMTEGKPFLDPDFCMSDLAEKVYSNKLYLSRTINILSGRNFRQFVNYHRVQYAMALFRKDPRLKVSEAAEMSGFNSAVSFNMAFKVNTGMSPSEWLHEHVQDPAERLASF